MILNKDEKIILLFLWLHWDYKLLNKSKELRIKYLKLFLFDYYFLGELSSIYFIVLSKYPSTNLNSLK